MPSRVLGVYRGNSTIIGMDEYNDLTQTYNSNT